MAADVQPETWNQASWWSSSWAHGKCRGWDRRISALRGETGTSRNSLRKLFPVVFLVTIFHALNVTQVKLRTCYHSDVYNACLRSQMCMLCTCSWIWSQTCWERRHWKRWGRLVKAPRHIYSGVLINRYGWGCLTFTLAKTVLPSAPISLDLLCAGNCWGTSHILPKFSWRVCS